MAEPVTRSERERRFFEAVPDLPPERLRGAPPTDPAPDLFSRMAAEAGRALAPPPPVAGLSARLTDWLRDPKRPPPRDAAGWRKFHRELLELEPDLLAGELDRVELAVEEVVVGPPVRVRSAARSGAAPSERRAALLRFLAWLDGLG